ncbi:alpha/beta hydrolase [soil metagenome]
MTGPVAGRWDRRRFLGAAAAGATLPWLASACGASDGPGVDDSNYGTGPSGTKAGQRATSRFTYAPGDSRFGELWLPSGAGPHPVVVLVHGGFWRTGYDLTLMNDLASDAATRGWAAWNIEFRRVGQDGGGWPGTFADVAAAIDHVAVIAEDAATPLDVDRVAVAGHSAGGHLAAWTAVRAGLPADAPGAEPLVRPVAVVSQAGVVDLRRAVVDGLGAGATVELMGATPEDEPERYDLGSPIERVPTGVPTRCVHGRRDDIVPVDQSESYVAAATGAGDEAVLAPFDGDHFAVFDPTHDSWTDTVGWLRPILEP